MSITDKYFKKIKKYRDDISIIDRDSTYTYDELINKVEYYLKYLRNQGIESGDVVFLLSDYSFNSIALFLSLIFNQNIAVPVTSEKDEEIKQRISVVDPDYIVNLRNESLQNLNSKSRNRHHLLQEVISSDAPGLILFSSGSTGEPKAMVHNLNSLLDQYLDRKKRNMNFLVFLMFDHIGGLNTLMGCLAMGAKIVLPKNRKPEEICRLIEQYEIHVLPTSPTFLNLILISESYKRYDLSSLKLITYGTEPMPDSLLEKLKRVFPKVKFLQTFGTSETGIAKTKSRSSSSTFLKIDDSDQEYKIVEGELWLRSKTQTLGYINHSNDRFTEDGWFKTGDLVEEKDGYLKIKGRNKELINVGGEKVLPAEVESVILELSEVLDCTVKAGENPITGQMVVANIKPKEKSNLKKLKKKIIQHCKTKLDSFKVPAKISFVDEIDFSDRFKKVRT